MRRASSVSKVATTHMLAARYRIKHDPHFEGEARGLVEVGRDFAKLEDPGMESTESDEIEAKSQLPEPPSFSRW